LQNLIGFDSGYFIEEPSTAGVHQNREALDFHHSEVQLLHSSYLIRGVRVFAEKAEYYLLICRVLHRYNHFGRPKHLP
jgi:hypothetical protein